MIKNYRYILALILLAPLFFAASGQDVKVTSVFDTSRIYIGDQIKYTVTIDKPEELKLSIPIFKDTISKSIEIVSGPRIDSVRQKGRLMIVEKYIITSYDSGRYQISPVFAEMKSETGLKRFYSDYALLEVMRVKITPPDSTAKIFDIVKPYRAPVTAGEVIPWVLIVVIAAAVIWFGRKYLKNFRRKDVEPELIADPDPAHIIAFRELERLKEEKLWQAGEIKLYYTRVTEILRQYLENRFRVYSLELTTSETLDVLVKTGFKRDASYNLLKSVLNRSDLVKFAKYKPEPEEHESVFQDSWNFVVATKEEIIPAEQAYQKDNNGEAKL